MKLKSQRQGYVFIMEHDFSDYTTIFEFPMYRREYTKLYIDTHNPYSIPNLLNSTNIGFYNFMTWLCLGIIGLSIIIFLQNNLFKLEENNVPYNHKGWSKWKLIAAHLILACGLIIPFINLQSVYVINTAREAYSSNYQEDINKAVDKWLTDNGINKERACREKPKELENSLMCGGTKNVDTTVTYSNEVGFIGKTVIEIVRDEQLIVGEVIKQQ